MSSTDDRVVLGRVSGLYGVQGWVKVFSETDPIANILRYRTWHLKSGGEWREYRVSSSKPHGKTLVAKLEGCDDRDAAAALVDATIAVPRSELPKLAEGEYYWADLTGLEVVTREGVSLGVVDHLFSTGSNDVVVVRGERERMIPFTQDFVDVDLEGGQLRVEWDPEF